jgi:hypothetical protein
LVDVFGEEANFERPSREGGRAEEEVQVGEEGQDAVPGALGLS